MRTHGGLVERAIESVVMWLRLAAVSTVQAALASDRAMPLVEAEHHGAAAERYEEAARNAERVAEGCRIQAEYHRGLAAIASGAREERA